MKAKEKLVPELRFPEFTDEWEEKELNKISRVYDGIHHTPIYTDDGIPFISAEDIENISETVKYISKEEYNKNYVEKHKEIEQNDILMTRIGSIGKTYLVKDNVKYGYYVTLALIKIIDKSINSKFLNYIISSDRVQRELHKKTLHVAYPKKINLGEINYIKFSHPSLSEQEKIGNFFYTIDQKLELQRKKIEELKNYKKGMMQRIFDQEIRFKDEDGNEYPEWEEKRLEEVILNLDNRVNNEKHVPILSSTSQGIYLQSEYFDNIVASKDISNYKLIRRNEFTYRSMSDTGKFTFNLQDIVDIGAVSPAYPVFDLKDNIINKWFYYYINNSDLIKRQLLRLYQGGTRLSLSLSKLSLLIIRVPSFFEQKKIANFLSSIDKKIELEEKKLKEFEKCKKGLMQRMFV